MLAIFCLSLDFVWGQTTTPTQGSVSIESASGAALPTPVTKRPGGATITLSGSGKGPLEVLDASGNVQEVLSSDDIVWNEIRPDVIEDERRLREQRLQRGEFLREQWLRNDAERQDAQVRSAAETRERLLEERLKNRPRLEEPTTQNWITLGADDRQFPTHLVDSEGNALPLPDPNPRKNVAQPRVAHPDPITPAGPEPR